jgi:hypothetical protein
MAHKMQTNRKICFVYRVYRHHLRETMALNKTSEKGLQNGWTRATFILRRDYLERLKVSAYWERKKIKEVIDEALGLYLKGKKPRTKINS